MVFEAVITSYVRLARNQAKYNHYPWLILMTTLIQELLYIILFIYKYFLHFQLFLNFIYKLCIGNWIEVKKKQQLDTFSENGKQIGYKIKFNIFITRQMVSFENLDAKEIQKLAIGAISILAIYCFSGIIHEYLIVFPYENIMTGESEILEDRAILVFFPCLTTWLIGYFYNQRLPNPVKIPQKNSFYCGGIVFVSTITYTWAVAKTSFPVVMAFKSCNLLSVLLVAILCSRVKQKKLKLGGNKLLVGLTVTAGIFLFSFFDPQVQDRSQASQAIGIVLLTISLIADGFLPDFQAQIKSEYKPQPTQMMQQINKYVAVISLVSIFLSFSAVRVAVYVFQHPTFILHLVGMSLLSCAGQFVVYYMIKQFKQHIVPFIITLRKILTIVFSILFYNHATSNLQILGICIVAVAVIYEFASQIQSKSAHNAPATHGQKFQITQKHLDGCLDQENALVGVEKGNFKI